MQAASRPVSVARLLLACSRRFTTKPHLAEMLEILPTYATSAVEVVSNEV